MLIPSRVPYERALAAVLGWRPPADVEALRPEASARSGVIAIRLRLREGGASEAMIFHDDARPDAIHRDLDRLAVNLRRRALAAAPLT